MTPPVPLLPMPVIIGLWDKVADDYYTTYRHRLSGHPPSAQLHYSLPAFTHLVEREVLRRIAAGGIAAEVLAIGQVEVPSGGGGAMKRAPRRPSSLNESQLRRLWERVAEDYAKQHGGQRLLGHPSFNELNISLPRFAALVEQELRDPTAGGAVDSLCIGEIEVP